MRAIVRTLSIHKWSSRTWNYWIIVALILIFATIGKTACTKIAEENRKPSPIDSGISHG